MDESIGLDDAYSLQGPDDNRQLYRRWADTYEESFIAAEGYLYHERVAALYAQRGGAGPVLDVGCGTGVVGEELAKLGIGPIDGVDISAEMLGKAAEKKREGRSVYRTLIEADLTEQISIESDRYSGLVSAGTFTHGHLGPESLAELVRVAAPGALAVVGINGAHFTELGFKQYLDDVLGDYETIEVPIYSDEETADPDRKAVVAVFEVS